MAMKKRGVSLKIVFFEYLVCMGLSIITAFMLPYFLFSIGLHMGWYTYANASELQVKNMEKKIASFESFDENLVPNSCTYAQLNTEYKVLKTDMNKQKLKNAILSAKGEEVPVAADECYFTIKRNDGYCVLQYYIRSRYNSDWMERYLPSPDRMLIILCVINSMIVCIIVTTLFGKYLKKQLLPLMNATKHIKEQTLNFEITFTKVKEFNDILLSFSDMKNELKNSLEQQWKIEQTKKEQTSALAHDIKTPLTIIKGNTELLNDTNQTDEQKEYTQYILKSTNKMEQYIKMLIYLTKAENGYQMNLQKMNTDTFICELKEQARGLAYAKHLNIIFEVTKLPEYLNADTDLLQRAIINVISNACNYSNENDNVTITITTIQSYLQFCITDSGVGFSACDKKQALHQFYMGDTSRNNKNHYGLGLYITHSIVKLHNGTLILSNSEITGGGQVIIKIPMIET